MFWRKYFANLGPYHVQNVPQVTTMSPLPHEPIFSGSVASNEATVDIPLGGSKVRLTM